MDISLNAMPNDTRALFVELATMGLPGDFHLIGGTCLAIQTAHRISEDLDLSTLSDTIDGHAVSMILKALRDNGHTVNLAMSQSVLSQAKINGYDLLDYVRDYLIDGKVKLTFVALRYDQKFRQYIEPLISRDNLYQFPMLSVEGVFATKSLVLEKRVRSRDLFDLHFMMKHHGYSVDQIFDYVTKYGENGVDYAKSVLTGVIPLDKEDEGFSALGVNVTMADIYRDFTSAIDAYEVAETKRIMTNLTMTSGDGVDFKLKKTIRKGSPTI